MNRNMREQMGHMKDHDTQRIVTVEFTEFELKQLEEFLDFGCRSQGLNVAQAAIALHRKLIDALRNHPAPNGEAVPITRPTLEAKDVVPMARPRL